MIQNLFKVAVTLALAGGEFLSGSKPADVEVSNINFVVLDYSYNFVALDCSYDSFFLHKVSSFGDLHHSVLVGAWRCRKKSSVFLPNMLFGRLV